MPVRITRVCVSTAALRTAGGFAAVASTGLGHDVVVTATRACVRLGSPAADGLLGLFLQTDESVG